MAGSINLSKLTTLAMTRDRIVIGAPFTGYTYEQAVAALRRSAARIEKAIAERAGFRLCDVTTAQISPCGGYVMLESFIWRD